MKQSKWSQPLVQYGGLLAVLILLIAVFSISSNNFFQASTLVTIANQVPDLTFLAVGMTLVLIVGGIDLSVGSTLGLAGVVALLLRDGRADPAMQDLGGNTPLIIAADKGHADVVRVLNGELHYCYAAKCAKPGHRSCSRCGQAWYCERKCQLRDWPTHKLVCGSAAGAGAGCRWV